MPPPSHSPPQSLMQCHEAEATIEKDSTKLWANTSGGNLLLMGDAHSEVVDSIWETVICQVNPQ